MKHSFTQRIILLLSLCLFSLLAGAAAVKTDIDRQDISQGESFTITYTYDGPYQDFDPDLSAFEQDFILYGKSTSAQMMIVEGKSNMRTRLALTLIPKKSGRLTIPSIRFAKGVSESRIITVAEASSVPMNTNGQSAYLEASVDDKAPYVQAQVLYTVKLLYATNLANSSLTDPVADNALVMRTGNDKQYQVTRQKKRYQVLERNYAIFPQQSGTLTIKSPVFTSIEQSSAQSFNGFNNLLTIGGKPLKLLARDVALTVKPIATSDNAWLPAKNLELKEGWSEQTEDFRVGDPISRTIVITATGLTAAQLPDVGQEKIPNVNIYPDKATTRNSTHDGDIIGQRQEKIAYIPQTAGTMTIPAVQVAWFDVKERKERMTVLPSRTLNILPAVDAAAATTASAATAAVAPAKTTPPPAPAQPATTVTHISVSHPLWQWVAGFFALAWVATVIAWLLSNQRQTPITLAPKITVVEKSKPSSSQLHQEIKNACLSSSARKARDALVKWGSYQWPQHTVKSLRSLANIIGEGPLADELRGLDERLYANSEDEWVGHALWHEFNRYTPKAASSTPILKAELPPLYPQR